MRLHRVLIISTAVWGVFSLAPLFGQTTQGLISGRVINNRTGVPIAGASVTYTSETLAATGTLKSDAAGYYFLPLLSAGTYSVRCEADSYQSQQLEELELPVAGRIQIEFAMRPLSDVWEAGQYRSVFLPGAKTIVTFYGPDVDSSKSGTFEAQQGTRGTLDTSMSYVIDPQQIGDLPLQGRDVYTMLVSLPNVTADQATARGLGVSVAGARPSESNFLLDGVSNNNYLVTGPLSPVAPEAIQEYRISTNNYSAEYGQTGGFVANAVTKAGGNAFHGIGYEYFENTVLNAADFQDNLAGTGRLPDKENQFGYQFGGPILKNRLFFSSALEQLISHSNESPQKIEVASPNILTYYLTPQNSLARQLLGEFPSPVVNNQTTIEGGEAFSVEQPVVVDRLVGLERGDYVTKSGRDHFMARLAIQRLKEPDFIWTPYPEFISVLHDKTVGIAGNWTHTWGPRITSELKLNYAVDNLGWNRPYPNVPTLTTVDTDTGLNVYLPGSPAFYEYENRNHTTEGIYSTVFTRNRHIITVGGAAIFRQNFGYLTAGRDGLYEFSNPFEFVQGNPLLFGVTISSVSATPTQPSFNRNYYYPQFYLFAQDSFRVTSRLTLNYGIRYDNFGGPKNTGSTKDALLQLGPGGGDFNTELAGSALVQPASGNQTIFAADNLDFAGRFGVSWDPFGKSKTVLRAGYGLFYDPPFDNLWQNVRANDLSLVEHQFAPNSGAFNYLEPISTAIAGFGARGLAPIGFPGITLMDPKLRNGYAQDAFAGVQQYITNNLTFELNGTMSLGRRLITSDIVNREFTVLTTALGRPNENLPDVYWRSSQGNSDYTAMSALVKYRYRTFYLQGAYTWSHAIDNQSDPLVGDFFDLDFTTITSAAGANSTRAAFATQFDSNGDRGNSDFDQRQNLFIVGLWQSEGRRFLTKGWQISSLIAFRGGFPYTISAPSQSFNFGAGEVENQRANVVSPNAVFLSSTVPVAGGVDVLNPLAFAEPFSANAVGNTGRNAFRGPGLYNVDLSLARSFSIPKLGESTRVTIRADAYNILNHANLNSPDALLGSPTFGLETYGRLGTASGFPAVSPVNETARQIQMLLRVEF